MQRTRRWGNHLRVRQLGKLNYYGRASGRAGEILNRFASERRGRVCLWKIPRVQIDRQRLTPARRLAWRKILEGVEKLCAGNERVTLTREFSRRQRRVNCGRTLRGRSTESLRQSESPTLAMWLVAGDFDDLRPNRAGRLCKRPRRRQHFSLRRSMSSCIASMFSSCRHRRIRINLPRDCLPRDAGHHQNCLNAFGGQQSDASTERGCSRWHIRFAEKASALRCNRPRFASRRGLQFRVGRLLFALCVWPLPFGNASVIGSPSIEEPTSLLDVSLLLANELNQSFNIVRGN